MLEPHSFNLSWLVKLRWGAILGQAALVFTAHQLMGAALPQGLLLGLILLAAASNLAPALWLRTGRTGAPWMLSALMVVDILLLTALLHVSGGPFNPFSILYLVNIALAAVVLPPAAAWTLFALAVACFGALFIQPLWFPGQESHAAHMAQMDLHLKGMWLAFAVAAALIVYFVQRVTRALAERDAQLAVAQDGFARAERLASLTTLAAGAAHELATPLSTIAVVAKEQELRLLREGAETEAAEDARLIRQQVARCRDILSRMATEAGEHAGEPLLAEELQRLVQDATDGLSDKHRIEVSALPGGEQVTAPRNALVQALRSVMKNALDASAPEATVTVKHRLANAELHLLVIDRGVGMKRQTLERATEPFFTTKPPGEGMGLGLFLARSVLERLGGRLELSSSEGMGTTVTLVLPRGPAHFPQGSV